MAKYADYMEITRFVEQAKSHLASLASVKTAPEKREDWEKFLAAWQTAVDKLIAYAESEKATAKLALRIASMNQKGDAVLAYCRVARNTSTHALAPSVKMLGSVTRLAGGISFSGDCSNIRIGSLAFGGQLYGENIEIETVDGLPTMVKGMKKPEYVTHTYDDVELAEIVTERNGKHHHRPTELNGKPLEPTDVHSVCEYALDWLNHYLGEVQRTI